MYCSFSYNLIKPHISFRFIHAFNVPFLYCILPNILFQQEMPHIKEERTSYMECKGI